MDAAPSRDRGARGRPATHGGGPAPHPAQALAASVAVAGALLCSAACVFGLAHPASGPRLASLLPHQAPPQAVGFAVAAILISLWLPLVAPARTTAATRPAVMTGLPRPPRAGIPFFGDTLASLSNARAIRDARHAKLGPIFAAWFMGHKFISVRGERLVKKLLQAEHVTVETQWPWRVRELLGPRSISTTHFGAHTALRKALAPAFGPAAVAGYIPLMERVCQEHAAAWAAAGPGFKGAAASKSFTFHVIAHVLGFHDGAHWAGPAARARANALFADWLGGFHPVGSSLPGGMLWKARAARRELIRMIDATLEPMIASRAAAARSGGGGGDGGGDGDEKEAGASAAAAHVMDRVVDALLAEHAGRSPGSAAAAAIMPAAADIALNLLFAGTDTSSTVLTLLLRSLAADPALARRLRAEQAAAVAAHGPDLSAAALEAMPLLAAAIKEQARVVPIVGQVFRTVVVDALDVGGCEVRRGETLVLDIAHTLQADARWAGTLDPADPAAPHKFHPDRWVPGAPGAPADAEALKREGGYIPFGGGPRLCVGYRLATAELLCMGATVLRTLRWTVASPGTDLVKPPNGLPLPTDGFVVEFRPVGGDPEQ
jgi:retinoid hydroxylase